MFTIFFLIGNYQQGENGKNIEPKNMFSHHTEKKPNLHNDYAFKMKRHKAH